MDPANIFIEKANAALLDVRCWLRYRLRCTEQRTRPTFRQGANPAPWLSPRAGACPDVNLTRWSQDIVFGVSRANSIPHKIAIFRGTKSTFRISRLRGK
jgi:hypothetical protein